MDKKKVLILIFILIMLFTVGCKRASTDKDENITFFSTDEDVFTIETPYCELKYPEVWKNDITTNKVELDDGYRVDIAASLGGEIIPLFDIIFEHEEGQSLGTLCIEGETIKVFIVDYNLELEGYEIEEQKKIMAMDEAINVIVSKLIEEYEFTLPI